MCPFNKFVEHPCGHNDQEVQNVSFCWDGVLRIISKLMMVKAGDFNEKKDQLIFLQLD